MHNMEKIATIADEYKLQQLKMLLLFTFRSSKE